MEEKILEVLKSAKFPMSSRRIAEELHEVSQLAKIRKILTKMTKDKKILVQKVKAYHHAYNPSFGGTTYASHMENKYSI